MISKDTATDVKIRRAVQMMDICSAEHYCKDNKLKRVLNNISLNVLVGESVGIAAKKDDEAKLLLEILANVRPYYSGKSILAEKGMMQKKRVILPHLFYIDTPNMLFDNMTVLEFLMFATVHSGISTVKRQRMYLDSLIEYGLEYIALTQIALLSDEEKLIIELIVASLSNSELVVFNVLAYEFSDRQVTTISKICKVIKGNGSIVIGTNEAKLIGVCCDKVAYVLGGTIEYFGSVDSLCKSWDKVLYRITDNHPTEVASKLQEIYSEYSYTVAGNSILVYNFSKNRISDTEFVSKLFENGISPDNIKINKGRVANSFEELDKEHDL